MALSGFRRFEVAREGKILPPDGDATQSVLHDESLLSGASSDGQNTLIGLGFAVILAMCYAPQASVIFVDFEVEDTRGARTGRPKGGRDVR